MQKSAYRRRSLVAQRWALFGPSFQRKTLGGAYVPALFAGMYASFRHQGADLAECGTFAPPGTGTGDDGYVRGRFYAILRRRSGAAQGAFTNKASVDILELRRTILANLPSDYEGFNRYGSGQ